MAPKERRGRAGPKGKQARQQSASAQGAFISSPMRHLNIAPTGKSPMPRKYVTTLRYADTVILDPGSGTIAYYILRASDCYDPDFTGTGHQPLGFDQLMLMYQFGVVLRAKIFVLFMNESNATGQAGLIGISVLGTSTAKTNVSAYLESSYTVWDGLQEGNGGVPPHLEMDLCPYKFNGNVNPTDDEHYIFSASASPSNVVFFHLFGIAADGVSDLTGITATFVIEYTVELYEPVQPAQS